MDPDELNCDEYENDPEEALFPQNSPIQTTQSSNSISLKIISTLKEHSDTIRYMSFSPCNKYLASTGWDSKICIWDCENWELSKNLTSHTDRVSIVQFSPDGTEIASGSNDSFVKIWQGTPPFELQHSLLCDNQNQDCLALVYSPDQKVIAAGYRNGLISILNAKTKETIKKYWESADPCWNLVYSLDSRFLYCGMENELKMLRASDMKLWKTMKRTSGTAWCIAHSPDRQHVACVFENRVIEVYKYPSGQLVRRIRDDNIQSLTMAFTPCSKYVVVNYYGALVKMMNIFGGKGYTIGKNDDAEVMSVAISSQLEVMVAGSDDRNIRVICLQDWKSKINEN